MDASLVFLEILRYAAPSILVFILVFLILKQFFEFQLRKQAMDIRRLNQQAITPVRLQAYERVILLMERINPSQLVMRMNQPNLSKKDFHALLIQQIRQEYEHNLTQQIYMTKGAWEAVKKAKEESIKLVNVAATRVPEDAAGLELGKAVLEMVMDIEKLPTQAAIDILKQEVRTLY